MRKDDPTFIQSTPVLKTGDYDAARNFWTRTLGFGITEEGGEPARFGIFQRGKSVVFVNGWNGPPTPVEGAWDAYFHVTDLNGFTEEVRAAGWAIAAEPHETVYGMLEMELKDPDGNLLCFGQDIPGAPTEKP